MAFDHSVTAEGFKHLWHQQKRAHNVSQCSKVPGVWRSYPTRYLGQVLHRKRVKRGSQIWQPKPWDPAQSLCTLNYPQQQHILHHEDRANSTISKLEQGNASTLTATFRWGYICWNCYKKVEDSQHHKNIRAPSCWGNTLSCRSYWSKWKQL